MDIALQTPLYMEFSRQEYWSGLPFLTPRAYSLPRDQNPISCISCIGRQILYHCITWEVQRIQYRLKKKDNSQWNLESFFFKKWGMKKLGWKSSKDCSKTLRKPWQSWLGAPQQGSPVSRVLHWVPSLSCSLEQEWPWSECCGGSTALVAGLWQSPCFLQQVVWETMWGASLRSCHITYMWLQNLCLVLKAKVILENAMGR